MSAKDTLKGIIEGHNLVSIATVDSDGLPSVRSVDYASDGSENTLYFITRADSRKVRHIRRSGHVAFSIDHDCPSMEDLLQLKYVKGTGVATVIDDPQEMQKAFGLLMEKFPFLKDLPGEPSDFAGVKLELKEVLVTDNTIKFGHTETVSF